MSSGLIIGGTIISKLFHRAFSDKYILITNVGLSTSLSAVGDILEQKYEHLTDGKGEWEPIRTRNMSISGFTIGFACHYWYIYLDKFLPGYTLRTVFKKILIDQFIGSPLCFSMFFGTLALVEGSTYKEFVEEVRQKAWRLYAAEWVIWPPAQFINFYLLPTRYRVLFDNSISLIYDVYTSRVKHYQVNND